MWVLAMPRTSYDVFAEIVMGFLPDIGGVRNLLVHVHGGRNNLINHCVDDQFVFRLIAVVNCLFFYKGDVELFQTVFSHTEDFNCNSACCQAFAKIVMGYLPDISGVRTMCHVLGEPPHSRH